MTRKIQPGFSLLELVIGIMISSILMTAALTIYNQIGKSATIIQKITTHDTKIMILHDRLNSDLTGISHRWFSEKIYDDLKKAKDAPKKPTEITNDKQKEESKNTEAKTDDKKKQKENFFFAQNTDNHVDFISFITTNGLQIYGDASSYFSRVTYKLIPDTSDTKVLRLMRKQENNASTNLDKEKIKEGLFYEIAGNISKFEIEYGFTIPSPEEQEKNPEHKTSFKWIKQWSQEADSAKEYQPFCPEALKLNISFSQGENKPKVSYEIFGILPPLNQEYPQSFAQKRSKNQKPETKDATASTEQGPAAKDISAPAASDLTSNSTLLVQTTSIGHPLDQAVLSGETANSQGATIISIGNP